MKKNNQIECQETENSQPVPPMDKLSDKIDQLVVTLNRVSIVGCFSYRMSTLSI